MLADAVFPVPPFVELIAPLVLFFAPPVVPVTFTLTTHEAFAATVPPVRLMLPVPAVAVTEPPQLLVTAGVLATTNPAGNASLNASPLSATVFATGLVMVKLRDVVPFSGIVAAPNAFAMDGGEITFWVNSEEVLLAIFAVPG
jgi:hypothetical protein